MLLVRSAEMRVLLMGAAFWLELVAAVSVSEAVNGGSYVLRSSELVDASS